MSSSAEIAIIGAGITGLMTAFMLVRQGRSVIIFEGGGASLDHACSAVAGGMLSPWCELESAEAMIGDLGQESLPQWREIINELGPDIFLETKGTLVLAHSRDRAEMDRLRRQLARQNQQGTAVELDGTAIAELEPALAGRFDRGLYLQGEGQLDPKSLLPALSRHLQAKGVEIRFNCHVSTPDDCHLIVDGETFSFDWVIDCRGLAARDRMADLRGVKGEVALIKTKEVRLNRMVRLMHPRYPLYIVPRPGDHFLIGATSIEAEDYSVSVRSALELLSAAYSLHPAFGEASIVSLQAHSRPALPHNQPRLRIKDGVMRINGLYRHGFLLAPALAGRAADFIQSGKISNQHAELYEVTP